MAGPTVSTGASCHRCRRGSPRADCRSRPRRTRRARSAARCDSSPLRARRSNGSERGSKSGTPIATETRPSSRITASTTPPGLSEAHRALVRCALRSGDERRDAARAVAALLDLGAVGVEDAVVDVGAGAARRRRAPAPGRNRCRCVGRRAGAAAPATGTSCGPGSVEDDEVVAEAVHLREREPHPPRIPDCVVRPAFSSGRRKCIDP